MFNLSVLRASRGWYLLTLAIVAMLSLGAWAMDDLILPRVIPKRWGEVEPGLIYRSGQLNEHLCKATLQEHKIQVVVDLTTPEPDTPYERAEVASCKALRIRRVVYPLGGNGLGDVDRYVAALVATRRAVLADQPVLVHCSSGSRRTGGVVAYYRIFFDGWDGARAVREMQEYDWRANGDGRRHLRFLNEHMAYVGRQLMAEGLIEKLPAPLPVLER